MRQRHLPAEDQPATTRHPIDVPTHQHRRACRRIPAARGQLIGVDQGADLETDTPLPRGHRLARQHRRAQRPGQHRQPVKSGGIARRHVDRQHRHLSSQRQPGETIRPAPVTHARGAHARHFAGRKHDQGLAVVQRAINAAQARSGAVAEYIHRQQQVPQLRHHGQPVVAQHPHVATHGADQLQQRQRVLHAQRMVGDHQQRAVHRNVLALLRVDVAVRSQQLERAIDKVEAARGAGLVKHAVEGGFVGQASEKPGHRAADPGVLRQPGHPLDQRLFNAQHVAPSRVSPNLSDDCDNRSSMCGVNAASPGLPRGKRLALRSPDAGTRRRRPGTSARTRRSTTCPSPAPARSARSRPASGTGRWR